jgi:hypothetical protein
VGTDRISQRSLGIECLARGRIRTFGSTGWQSFGRFARHASHNRGKIRLRPAFRIILGLACLVTVLGSSALAKAVVAKAGVAKAGVAKTVLANELPIPPIPPASHPSSTPAPVPDDQVRAPIAEVNSGPSVALRFYRNPAYTQGAGFTPGSQFQTPEDRKPIQTPGFSVSVPLK